MTTLNDDAARDYNGAPDLSEENVDAMIGLFDGLVFECNLGNTPAEHTQYDTRPL